MPSRLIHASIKAVNAIRLQSEAYAFLIYVITY